MPTSSSVRAELREARALLAASSRDPERDASLLLCSVLGKDRAWLWTHPDELLFAEHTNRYRELVQRRSRHEPMQYILGEQEFYGLTFKVTPAVLIPRPETELLIEAVLAWAPRASAPPRPIRLVDIGTGSGAIAVTLARLLPEAEMTALDVSPPALEVARENAARHGVEERIRFLQSDLLATVAGEQFDAVISNPPYVSTDEELELQVRRFEPALALYAGSSGLEIYRRLVPSAAAVLRPAGLLALELGAGQQPALHALLREDGRWSDFAFAPDLQGIPRVVTARHRGSLT